MTFGFRALLPWLFPLTAMAQSTPAPGSPTAVVGDAFQALATHQWGRFASLIHPDALEQFREQQLQFAQAWAQMPAKNKVSAPAQNPTLEDFPGIRSVADLGALPPAQLYARYVAAQVPDPANYEGGKPPLWMRTPIGCVQENDTLAHVVYRKQVDVGRYGATEETEVVTVRRLGNDWRLLLNQDLAFMGSIRITRRGPPEEPH